MGCRPEIGASLVGKRIKMEPLHALRPGLDAPVTEAEIAASADLGHGWDVAYERKAVLLLALGFGLVGLDRFMILPMFPSIRRDLHLGYQDLGEITGALAITWGVASLFAGRLADRFGQRRLVLTGVVMFSLLVGLSGVATGLATLVATHNLDLASRMDRRVTLAEGRVVER